MRYDSGKNRFVVDTEGPRFFLRYETINQYDLKKDMDIAPYADLFTEETERLKATDYVYKMLTSRAASSHEVRIRLQRRKTPASIIEEVLSYFIKQDLLDDSAYLRASVKDQIEIKGYGPWRIVANLRTKGYEKEEVLSVYGTLSTAEEETRRAETYAKTQWPLLRGKTLQQRKKKLSDRLLRQGFSYDVISDILGNLDE